MAEREARRTGTGEERSWLAGLVQASGREGRIKGQTLKALWLLGLVVVIGIGLMSLADLLRPAAGVPGAHVEVAPSAGRAGTAGAASQGPTGGLSTVDELKAMLEEDLERILSRVEGAGKVTVAVFLEAGATYVYGYDTTESTQRTEERDASGGTRVVTQTDTIRTAVVVSQGAGSQPVVERVVLPRVRGVVVVASGAADARVKAVLSLAVQTLLGVPAHKVVVLPGG